MKITTKEAIEILQRYNPNEEIFIWFYGYDDIEIDQELDASLDKSKWDEAVDNCDLIDDQIRDSIKLLLQDNQSLIPTTPINFGVFGDCRWSE